MSNKGINFNKNVINVADEMNNVMMVLLELKLLYFYRDVRPQLIDNKLQIITWNNHESSRANCGPSFTTLEQYEHILKTGAFHCILFDGSIIRSSFEFAGKDLIYHSHLWWPAPYTNSIKPDEFTPQTKYEDLLTDPDWTKKVRMRSPIRIDFDPDLENESHPLVHLHTQNHETRMKVDKPICFGKFMKYILQNFYPDIKMDFRGWNLISFSHQEPSISDYQCSSVTL